MYKDNILNPLKSIKLCGYLISPRLSLCVYYNLYALHPGTASNDNFYNVKIDMNACWNYHLVCLKKLWVFWFI